MNIKIIRLMNGEEIIGEMVSETSSEIELSKPGVVQMIPSQTGFNIGLFPFAPYAEETKFTFKEEHIVTMFTPGIDLLNNYNKMFGSGIQIATPGSLLK